MQPKPWASAAPCRWAATSNPRGLPCAPSIWIRAFWGRWPCIPNDAPDYAARGELEDALAEIEELAAHPRVRAIGETGLDFFRTEGEGLAHQRYSFRRHIDIAKRLDRTLQIHDRDAHDDVVQVLREEGTPERVVFHCFSGDAELARICNSEGWFMSFAGTLTFKNAANLGRRSPWRTLSWCWSKPTRRSSLRTRTAAALTPATWCRTPCGRWRN
jgi:hypothetical protein